MTRYEHTQIGKIMICALLGAAAVAGMGAIMRGDSIAFVITAILLLTITGFYKLTVKIDNEKLRADSDSLVVWLGNSLHALRLALQHFGLGRSCDRVARWTKIRVRHK